jgi:hypothetical protein
MHLHYLQLLLRHFRILPFRRLSKMWMKGSGCWGFLIGSPNGGEDGHIVGDNTLPLYITISLAIGFRPFL